MEVEIKLHVPAAIAGGPAALFARLAALPALGGRPLGEPVAQRVRDLYVDTPDSALTAARAGLRLRLEDDRELITLKVSRHRDGALTVRAEYEEPLTPASLAAMLDRIRPLIGPAAVPFEPLRQGLPAGPLRPLLDVITHRTARTVGDFALLTLDRVEYPGLCPDPFWDIELEAVDSSADPTGLLRLADALQAEAGGHLIPSAHSKLERGLRLRQP